MKIIELLKKYLLEKWWIPILIFGISFFLLINEYLLPNTNFSIYLFYISGLILVVSFVWQFFKRSKIIGILQLSILIIPVLIYGYIFYLIAMMFNKPVEKLAHQNIELLIEDKTNLELPSEYKILKNTRFINTGKGA
ncbi:hypothetical protein [uncultured Aquimarina sp.]|uniref:hypothetical protein n=1 Tax=uncultured Aquimarina sp. TaxID=575652 RepID=UPI0026137612|nr:hypothetical protein [uncultured Aquimarina sp.]